jgi:hypothetical protein
LLALSCRMPLAECKYRGRCQWHRCLYSRSSRREFIRSQLHVSGAATDTFFIGHWISP